MIYQTERVKVYQVGPRNIALEIDDGKVCDHVEMTLQELHELGMAVVSHFRLREMGYQELSN